MEAGDIIEEAIGAINEIAIGTIIAPRNALSCFLVCVLMFHSHHQLIDLIFFVTL